MRGICNSQHHFSVLHRYNTRLILMLRVLNPINCFQIQGEEDGRREGHDDARTKDREAMCVASEVILNLAVFLVTGTIRWSELPAMVAVASGLLHLRDTLPSGCGVLVCFTVTRRQCVRGVCVCIVIIRCVGVHSLCQNLSSSL